MTLPKFLMADNSEFPEDIFIVHTEYPRFVLNVEEEEIEWFDDIQGDNEEEVEEEITKIIEDAYKFCDSEIEKYEAEEEDND